MLVILLQIEVKIYTYMILQTISRIGQGQFVAPDDACGGRKVVQGNKPRAHSDTYFTSPSFDQDIYPRIVSTYILSAPNAHPFNMRETTFPPAAKYPSKVVGDFGEHD